MPPTMRDSTNNILPPGEQIVFKDTDICIITSLSHNGRLFAVPKDSVDKLKPLPVSQTRFPIAIKVCPFHKLPFLFFFLNYFSYTQLSEGATQGRRVIRPML